jgi:hypothetical protein
MRRSKIPPPSVSNPHPHGTEHQLAETALLQRFARLHDRVLFYHEQFDASLIAGVDHGVGIVQAQRHRFFDDDVFAGFSDGDSLLVMYAARRQDRHDVEVLYRQHGLEIRHGRDLVGCGNLLAAPGMLSHTATSRALAMTPLERRSACLFAMRPQPKSPKPIMVQSPSVLCTRTGAHPYFELELTAAAEE